MSGRRFYFNIKHKFIRLLNPALCISCGIPVKPVAFLCQHCVDSLETVPSPCSCCGLPHNTAGSTCAACLHQPPRWKKIIAPLIYTGETRNIIHQLKFNEQIHYANALLTHTHDLYDYHHVEALIPVPLHRTKMQQRGFNQSEEIASILSRFVNIPVDNSSLTRIKATEPQSGLSLNKRQQNILKAFKYQPLLHYQSVAIVDDVVTTGSTVNEICKVLYKSGVQHIEVWSLARALKHD